MIVLKILGFVLLAVCFIILIILLLPVYVYVYNDDEGEVQIRYRFLWWKFGENPNPNNPLLIEIKNALGLSKIESADTIRKNVKGAGVATTATQIISILRSLIGRVFWLLKYCRIVRLKITSISADADAAGAAMDYGLACAVIYPLVGYAESNMHIKKHAVDLDVRCDFDGNESTFSVDIIFRITVIYILRAFFHIVKINAEKEILKAREQENGKRKQEQKQ